MMKELYSIYLKSSGVSTDTRDDMQNKLFFALRGENFDANTFSQQAEDKGAIAVVIDNPDYKTEKSIVVDDSLKTLQVLAKYHREQLGIPVLAITGSNGKTTTKELLYSTLSTHLKVTATKGNLNNHIGVPLSLLSIPLDTDFAIIEMGANHIGEIASYCSYAEPNYGIITNIGKAHLEGFGSLEGVKKAKGELYKYIASVDGKVYYCKDLSYLQEMSLGINRVSYGLDSSSDVVGTILDSDELLKMECKGYEIQTQLTGDYNFPNVMAAITVGLDQGMTMDEIKKNIEAYKPDNSRSQMVELANGTKLILDAYNANPTSMQLAIQNLNEIKGPTKIACLGAMKELGQDSQEEHQQLINSLKDTSIDQVILVGQEFENCDKKNYLYFPDSEAAGNYLAKKLPDTPAVILIKGSRASKMENIFKALEK